MLVFLALLLSFRFSLVVPCASSSNRYCCSASCLFLFLCVSFIVWLILSNRKRLLHQFKSAPQISHCFGADPPPPPNNDVLLNTMARLVQSDRIFIWWAYASSGFVNVVGTINVQMGSCVAARIIAGTYSGRLIGYILKARVGMTCGRQSY